MDVATIHTVGPGDIIGEHGQHAVYVPRVKAIVDAFKDFDVIVHWVSPCTTLRPSRTSLEVREVPSGSAKATATVPKLT
jgi:hypothetical protein